MAAESSTEYRDHEQHHGNYAFGVGRRQKHIGAAAFQYLLLDRNRCRDHRLVISVRLGRCQDHGVVLSLVLSELMISAIGTISKGC